MYGLDWTVSVILYCFKMVTENMEDCCAFESVVVQLDSFGVVLTARTPQCHTPEMSTLSMSQDVS